VVKLGIKSTLSGCVAQSMTRGDETALATVTCRAQLRNHNPTVPLAFLATEDLRHHTWPQALGNKSSVPDWKHDALLARWWCA
jgi:hypothetical protein